MKAIAIDDEPWMLRHFADECADLDDFELVGSFRNPLAALEYAQSNKIDLAFIDMEMPQLSGAQTASRLSELQPEIKIIIVSAYEESYILSMHQRTTYGYLRKPYKSDELQAAVNKIKQR